MASSPQQLHREALDHVLDLWGVDGRSHFAMCMRLSDYSSDIVGLSCLSDSDILANDYLDTPGNQHRPDLYYGRYLHAWRSFCIWLVKEFKVILSPARILAVTKEEYDGYLRDRYWYDSPYLGMFPSQPSVPDPQPPSASIPGADNSPSAPVFDNNNNYQSAPSFVSPVDESRIARSHGEDSLEVVRPSNSLSPFPRRSGTVYRTDRSHGEDYGIVQPTDAHPSDGMLRSPSIPPFPVAPPCDPSVPAPVPDCPSVEDRTDLSHGEAIGSVQLPDAHSSPSNIPIPSADVVPICDQRVPVPAPVSDCPSTEDRTALSHGEDYGIVQLTDAHSSDGAFDSMNVIGSNNPPYPVIVDVSALPRRWHAPAPVTDDCPSSVLSHAELLDGEPSNGELSTMCVVFQSTSPISDSHRPINLFDDEYPPDWTFDPWCDPILAPDYGYLDVSLSELAHGLLDDFLLRSMDRSLGAILPAVAQYDDDSVPMHAQGNGERCSTVPFVVNLRSNNQPAIVSDVVATSTSPRPIVTPEVDRSHLFHPDDGDPVATPAATLFRPSHLFHPDDGDPVVSPAALSPSHLFHPDDGDPAPQFFLFHPDDGDPDY